MLLSRAALRSFLLRRNVLSEWIVTRKWYRNGPIGLLLLVRDEADIIRANLDFHFDQGVDFVIATDNGSKDGTRDVLAEYARRADVIVLDEASDTYEQARWVTRMVRVARRQFRAKWILPADADEFWLPGPGGYRQTLCSPSNVFRGYWRNMLPEHGRKWTSFTQVGDFLTYNGRMSKVLCATFGFHQIYQGNHDVRIAPHLESDSPDLRIYHYPIRSYEQFETKVVNGGRAYERNPVAAGTWGSHWRAWYAAYQAGCLRQVYDGLASANRLERDETMARYFESRLSNPEHAR